ncbi:hypothetical protein P4G95_09460 [Burkholderia vietnamiensis]|nr:hypothetical protein [Burkholderia vietnamiensis]MBR8279942.1 hypothetical protein [Burkholderia vietnamiensis]WHU91103.1 hypothetical protein P4G95_09460 [Burkholderia vietnamiensis]HDR8998374.1 hypothetical protein [Burkholderia vietnamiensis]HDR9030671.1 hypothetical protein [Burkholderia vietnamiensis]
MNSVTLRMDFGKRQFHVVGCAASGKAVRREKLARNCRHVEQQGRKH